MTAADQLESNGASATQEAAASGAETMRPSLASLLIEAGAASEEQLRLAAAEAMGSHKRLGEVVLGRGWIDEEGMAKLLARQWGLDFVDGAVVEAATVDRELLSVAEARRVGACAIRMPDGAVLILVSEPATDRLNELRGLIENPVFGVVTDARLNELLHEPQSPTESAAIEADDAPGSTESAEADSLVAELESATAALAALAKRAEHMTAGRRSDESEIAELRSELASLRRERLEEQARAEELRQELDRERARREAIRTKLADLLHELSR